MYVVSIPSKGDIPTREAYRSLALFEEELGMTHVIADSTAEALYKLDDTVPTLVICPVGELPKWALEATPRQLEASIVAICAKGEEAGVASAKRNGLHIVSQFRVEAESDTISLGLMVLDQMLNCRAITQQQVASTTLNFCASQIIGEHHRRSSTALDMRRVAFTENNL